MCDESQRKISKNDLYYEYSQECPGKVSVEGRPSGNAPVKKNSDIHFRGISHVNFLEAERKESCIRKCSNMSRTSQTTLQYMDSSEEYNFPRNATCHCLQQFLIFLSKMFYKLGYLIASHPSYFIAVPIFITLIGVTGLQRMRYEKDPEYLFSPENGEGQLARNVIENLFPINYSAHFDPSRLTRMSHFGILFVLAKDNGSMFREKIFNEVVQLDQGVRNLTIEWQQDVYNYTQICAKMNNECLENQILSLQSLMPEIENGSLLLNYPIMLYPLIFPFHFGGPVVNETEGVILGTKAVSLTYFFRDDDWKQKERSHTFEGKILEFLDASNFEHLHVARFVSRSLTDELDNNAQAITPYIGLTVALMISLSIGSAILSDWVRSKLSVGIFGVLAAMFGTACAFGFLMYCNVVFIGINMVAPFLMLGIGIDNMFVILSAWHRTKPQDKVPIRLAKTYSEAAMSITITSLTNMLSFFSGTITPIPAVRIFCLYTGLSIFFAYLWCITFFGGCLAIAGIQESKRRHTITCQPVLSVSESENLGCCYKFWCAGGINPKDPMNTEDNKSPVIMNFFRDYIGRALNMPVVKALVIGFFLVYLGGAIFGYTQVKEGLERRRLALDSSYLVDFFNTEDKLFRKYPYRIQVVIDEKLTYSDPKTKMAIKDLHESFENLNCTGSRLFTQSWLRGFYKFLDRRPELKKNITDEKSFIKVLKTKYLTPATPEYLDVVFSEDGTQIVASRFIIQSYDIKDTNADKDMMTELRNVALKSPFKVIVYHPFFVFFDQYMMVRSTCLQTVALDATVMVAVSLVFIPNLLCSLWVAFSIISIEIGVIGYMSFWGVSLDSISMINLIMCVGFSVDFSAHISYAYLTAQATTTAGRVEECLYNLGLPFLQGGLSTIVGVLALVVAPSYIFTTFFKIVFLVIIFGIMHGTILLPVLLSILGPGSCSRDKTEDSLVVPKPPAASIPEEVQAATRMRDIERESLERDLGLGSSGCPSSQSSLHESDNLPCTSDQESLSIEGIPSRKTSSEGNSTEEEDEVVVVRL